MLNLKTPKMLRKQYPKLEMLPWRLARPCIIKDNQAQAHLDSPGKEAIRIRMVVKNNEYVIYVYLPIQTYLDKNYLEISKFDIILCLQLRQL